MANNVKKTCSECRKILEADCNFCPDCGAPAPIVVPATVVGVQVMGDHPAVEQPPQSVPLTDAAAEQPTNPIAKIYNNPHYLPIIFIISACNTALIILSFIMRLTSETPGDEENGPIPETIQRALQNFFTIVFVIDASFGFYVGHFNYLRRGGVLHVVVAVCAVVDTWIGAFFATMDSRINFWSITGIKVVGYIGRIRRRMSNSGGG